MSLISSYYFKGGATYFCAQTEKSTKRKKKPHKSKAHPKCIVLFDDFFVL